MSLCNVSHFHYPFKKIQPTSQRQLLHTDREISKENLQLA